MIDQPLHTPEVFLFLSQKFFIIVVQHLDFTSLAGYNLFKFKYLLG